MSGNGLLHSWRVPGPAGGQLDKDLRELLPYCFPDGSGWAAAELDGVLQVTFEGPYDETVRRLQEAYRRALAGPASPAPAVYDHWVERPAAPGEAEDTEVGPGLRVAGAALTRLARLVDDLARDLAERLGATDHDVPHLVSWSTLDRGGYPRTFPQHLISCGVVRPDLDALDRFAAAPDLPARERELGLAPVCVSPTVCLHLFAAAADRQLAGPLLLTARQSCGRHEATPSATRLWSFAMREIVYIGDAAGARAFRDDVLSATRELAEALGLPCRLVPATDPFFTRMRGDLTRFQHSFDLKYELLGRMPDGQAVANTSVNLHQQHFGQGFGIRDPRGRDAASACIGFGLDRWARWLHAYLGPDPANWPGVLTSPGLSRPAGPGRSPGR